MNVQPDKIGRYPVVRLIGRGSMGSVYLARDTELDRDVAIKTVRSAGNTPEEQESFFIRFRNEARAVGRLKHPSIVAVYDVGTDPRVGPYIVFEYVEGSTLKQLLAAKGPLEPRALVTLAEQVGEALEVAHRAGIIHRDIKPENLLVGRDGRAHLADFGVARVPDAALTGEGQFLGTPCYAAPETLRGGEVGPKSDQFSFAGVLYEAATGARAFPGEEALAVAQCVIHDQPAAPSLVRVAGADVPKAVDAVILRGLAKQPSERFDSIADLVVSLRAAYTDAGVLTVAGMADTLPALRLSVPPARRRSLPPEPRKRPLPWWPFALALLFGIAVMVQFAPRIPAGEPEVDPLQLTVIPKDRVTGIPTAPDSKVGDAASISAARPDAKIEPPGRDAAAPAAPERLSTFEREERAKDALERAQRALEQGDKEAARRALDEAYSYDPEHPDIEDLRRKAGAATP